MIQTAGSRPRTARADGPDRPAGETPSKLPEVNVQNIILAGFMGSGKTTVGRKLARRLGWEFIDTDRMIEAREGRTIPEIFEQSGESAFRDMETDLARELGTMDRCVVSTGGGFMLRPENLAASSEAGIVILLAATPEEIWRRVGGSGHRPLLKSPDPQGRIRELMAERAGAYEAIARRIMTDERPPEVIVEEILEMVKT